MNKDRTRGKAPRSDHSEFTLGFCLGCALCSNAFPILSLSDMHVDLSAEGAKLGTSVPFPG